MTTFSESIFPTGQCVEARGASRRIPGSSEKEIPSKFALWKRARANTNPKRSSYFEFERHLAPRARHFQPLIRVQPSMPGVGYVRHRSPATRKQSPTTIDPHHRSALANLQKP